ncbi:MAG: nicotinate-nucleotide--dimethylbenzimidazole phosphoribosyltransferase [Acidiferrobacteraceae bacterium]|nr:nicotinate-nucleotide--dimethylbenzimidazole phosphoribosyltransferase [Acidiferrobacteraceae bacterium]
MTADLEWIDTHAKEVSLKHAEKAQARQADLTKPLGSLGELEDIAVRLAAMQYTEEPTTNPTHICIFASDHGVAEMGVSAYPQSVTGQMIKNFSDGGAAINVLAKQLQATLQVISLGVVNDISGPDEIERIPHLTATENIAVKPAMTLPELILAINAGHDSIERVCNAGVRLFIGGEMGIANTTAASAMACAHLGLTPEHMAGPGTGLDALGVQKKSKIVELAIKQYEKSKLNDGPLEILRCLGGLDIAGLVGSYIRSGQRGVPVLIDGFISSVAALTACRINPSVLKWFFFGHQSAEPGHRYILDNLNVKPMLNLKMRLGEGSGAAIAAILLRAACELHNSMATFESAGIASNTNGR